MSKIEFTAAQKRAIELRGKDILVYASAGSGKTTVLIQRIIRSILNGTSLDSMLIVTFTRAAAGEMRDRLRQALNLVLQQEDLDFAQEEFLRSQIASLQTADIETIDSFCQKVIRAYFNVVGIDPGFRIMTDQNEIDELKLAPFNEAFGEFLAKKGQEFFNLVKNFTDGKTIQRYQDLIHDLEAYSSSLANQKEWLNSLDKMYRFEKTFSDSYFYHNDFKPYLKQQIVFFVSKFKQIANLSEEYPDLDFYLQEALKGIDYFSNLAKRLPDLDYAVVKEQLFDFDFARAKPVRNKDEALQETKQMVQDERTALKKSWTGLKKLFQFSESELNELSKKTGERIKLLSEFTISYLSKVELVKRSENAYEFSDLERFAHEILTNSEVARTTYQKRFKEILIDEYQDINNLQDAILTTLSGDQHNLFMVGDIKQSIYGFRHANPRLFLKKYQDFQDPAKVDQEVIIIAQNYRSVENIDDSVNFFFEQLMDQEVGELEYDENSHLQFGAKYYPSTLDSEVEFLVENGSEQDFSQSQALAQVTVQRIQQMLGHHEQIYDIQTKKLREVKLSDIAILTRTKAENRVITEAFAQAGLNIFSGQNEDFFVTTEIKVIISLLKVVDNPDQDIPFVAILKSPFGRLSDNDLALIRSKDEQKSFWKAALAYQEAFEDELSDKLKRICALIQNARELAGNHNLVELLTNIYQDQHFLDYVSLMVGGSFRIANLRTFLLQAKDFQERGISGLGEFVRYLERVEKSSVRPKIAEQKSEDQEAVQLITMHAAKGLEFPVVFLYRVNRQFNLRDFSGSYVLNEQAGIGLNLIDEHNISYFLPQIEFIKQKEKSKLISEEMRILYVAMTRAKEKLIVVGSDESFLNDLLDSNVSPDLILSKEEREKANSFLKMFKLALKGQVLALDEHSAISAPKNVNNHAQIKIIQVEAKPVTKTTEIKQNVELSDLINPCDQLKLKEIDTAFSWQYSQLGATQTSAYQSVSDLKTLFQEPDDDNLQAARFSAFNVQKNEFALPEFKGNKKVTSSEVGSATHLLLREISLKKAPTEESLQTKISELVARNLIKVSVGSQIKLSPIVKFFETDLGQLILNESTVFYREQSFQAVANPNVLYPNEQFGTQDSVLIHGIIDGFLNLPTEIILLDYKTDHLGNKNNFERTKTLIKRYEGQLKVYGEVLFSMYHKPVKKNLVALDGPTVIEVN
ncbi:helicase-exonuclease AddAB subunit AddA [Xylocopilactobacillus apicola]|uniref:DNA 3'-5' helicase n=1 Tax=Xylocopilactobacillus apicola TaxID=2932184 RepID=A0AAU9DEP9_9LACO|nr:helicase-exonuclease AddAB subunit AddA [Xylocopilactobacillus apicola]BDR58380.1 ATP-dependent helicase/nuclease subunit A [Xylocopilactobacillus apicola]